MKTFKEFISEADGWKKTATMSIEDAHKRFPEHSRDIGLLNNRDWIDTKHENGKRRIMRVAGRIQVRDHTEATK